MENSRRHWPVIVLDWVLILATFVSTLSLLFVLLAGVVNPASTTFFAFFALGAPIIYLANILLLAMWTARWSRWALLPLVVMMWGVWSVGKFLQVDFLKQYDDPPSKVKKELSILTYNVHNFRSLHSSSANSIDEVLSFVAADDYDIICLQEYQILDSVELHRVDDILHRWPYRAYTYDIKTVFNHFGQVVMSKYPLSGSHPISFDGTSNGAMYVDIYTPIDTVRLFNCHLQTTAFNQVNHERGVRALLADSNSQQMAQSVISGLRENFVIRSSQADTVATLIAHSPYPVIALGDLNSPPMTYTYDRIRGDMADAFCERGSGYGYTYKPMAKLFRIDYIFFDDRNFECVSYQSPNKPWSDHNPVLVKLKRK